MSLHLFKFTENIPLNYQSAIPLDFKINSNTKYNILIIRLLTSTLDITYKKNNIKIKLENNFATFPFHRLTRKSTKPLKAIFHPNSLNKFGKFSNKNYPKNIIFYKNLLQEFSFFFYYSNQKNHLSAFINLYRILEYISYSFPLYHFSHQGNIVGTFESLKSFFLSEKTSELKFFELFVNKLFNGTSYLSITTDFDFSSNDQDISENCFYAFKSLLKNELWVSSDISGKILSIENKNLIQLFKNLRNRFLHFAVGGQTNLQIIDIKDPDFFFERINIKLLNWISFIFITITSDSVDNSI